MLTPLAPERLDEPGTTVLDDALARALDPGAERPRLHPDAELVLFTTRWGERYAVGHSAYGDNYLRIDGENADVALDLDGQRSVADLAASRIDAGADGADLAELLGVLRNQGFMHRPPRDVYEAVGSRLVSPARRALAAMWQAMKAQTVPMPGADGIVGAVYRYGGWLFFRRVALIATAVMIAVGLVAFWASADNPGNTITGELSPSAALSLIGLQLVVLAIHELGHALAIKHRGRRVRRAGFQLYLGNPAFFVDSTDMILEPPRARALNAVAGPYAQAVTGSVASVVAWAVPGSGLGTLSFRLAGLTYLSVLLNLIPFIELDGYWLLSDLLEVPGLRHRAAAVLRHEVPARVLRRRGPLAAAERWLVAFAVLALLFTAAALALAWQLWAPVASAIVRSLWDQGLLGRSVLAILLALVVGPMAHAGGGALRSAARRAGTVLANLRFRLESSWRVEAAEAIAALPFVHDIDDDALADLAGRVGRRRVRHGDVVVRAGSAADAFYVVRRGEFEVVETSFEGAERVLHRAGPGEAFGELALLERRPRTASVRASADGELFVIDGGAFLRLLGPVTVTPDLPPSVQAVVEVWALGPFRHLDQAAASQLAGAGRWITAIPGSEIVTQGSMADAFFAIASGQAEVLVAGAAVRVLRAGDHFGEIALLQRSARTATVRALTPMRLFRIDADAFHTFVSSALAAGARRPVRDMSPEVH